MEITELREISKAAASKLQIEKRKWALAWWIRKGKKKVLRAAKRGSDDVTVIVRMKYEGVVRVLLESKGYEAWVITRGVLFCTVKIFW